MQIWVGLGRRKWRRKWHPIPLFLLRQSHGQRSLAGYSPWGHRESHTTEHTHIYIVYPQTEPWTQEILSISKFYNLMRERSASDTPQKYKGIVDISLEVSVDSRVYCIHGVLTPQMQAHQCQAAENEFVLRFATKQVAKQCLVNEILYSVGALPSGTGSRFMKSEDDTSLLSKSCCTQAFQLRDSSNPDSPGTCAC